MVSKDGFCLIANVLCAGFALREQDYAVLLFAVHHDA